MMFVRSCRSAAAILLFCLYVARTPLAADTAPPQAASVSGFRQALFGMTEPELRQAIRRDFPAEADHLTRRTHPQERTTVLTLPVEDLLPATGIAQIAYIIGYASKRLIQVNVTFASDGKSAEHDSQLVTAANTLRDYLQAQYGALHDIILNRKLPDDSVVVFRASDPTARMVLLLLAHNPRPAPGLTLRLSYILDTAKPDIYRIESGRF
jgi:hypothetical protein